MHQKGFALIIPLIVGVIVVIGGVGAYWFLSGNDITNIRSTISTNKATSKTKEDKNFNRLSKEELDEIGQINNQLKKYSNSRMIFTSGAPSTDPSWWSHWNITESDLKNKNIILNPKYKSQTINGLKNFSIIQNGYETMDLNQVRVFWGLSNRFIEIFESLVIKANTEIVAGQIWFNLSDPEKYIYLLANPSRGAKVLQESKYKDAFKIVKTYILKQNKQNVNEIMAICNSAKFEITKYDCYFQVSSEYIDDFDCNLFPDERVEDRKTCFIWKAVYNQDIKYCEQTESSWCETQVHIAN